MAAIAVVGTGELAVAGRWDAEAFSPSLRRLESALSGAPCLNDLAAVIHPTEIPRVYTDGSDGVPFVLAANIRPILPDFNTMARISFATAKELRQNRLECGDVMVTRTGANHGVACTYLEASGAFYASGEGLIVRSKQGIDGAYLGAYLGCIYGDQLCKKAAYGSGQPHIAPSYLRTLPVLRLGEQEKVIGDLIRDGWRESQKAAPLYGEAEAEMAKCLDWEILAKCPTPDLSYVESYRTVSAAGRCDPEFFSPRAKALYKMLNRDGRKIHDVASLAFRRFDPKPGVSFRYIEITDVDDIGQFATSIVPGEEAPERAKWLVEEGDVLTSTVRPIRRLTGVVAHDQVGSVCSSGFAVLCSKAVEPEVLLLYLRLPPVCELLDVYTTASMYPAISTTDLLRIPISLPPKDSRQEIVAKLRRAWSAR
jgi:hypothetical protein